MQLVSLPNSYLGPREFPNVEIATATVDAAPKLFRKHLVACTLSTIWLNLYKSRSDKGRSLSAKEDILYPKLEKGVPLNYHADLRI